MTRKKFSQCSEEQEDFCEKKVRIDQKKSRPIRRAAAYLKGVEQ